MTNTKHTQEAATDAEGVKYNDLGGVYFPILQQDGKRILTKVGNGKDASSFLFLQYLRQHDRKIAPQKGKPDGK